MLNPDAAAFEPSVAAIQGGEDGGKQKRRRRGKGKGQGKSKGAGEGEGAAPEAPTGDTSSASGRDANLRSSPQQSGPKGGRGRSSRGNARKGDRGDRGRNPVDVQLKSNSRWREEPQEAPPEPSAPTRRRPPSPPSEEDSLAASRESFRLARRLRLEREAAEEAMAQERLMTHFPTLSGSHAPPTGNMDMLPTSHEHEPVESARVSVPAFAAVLAAEPQSNHEGTGATPMKEGGGVVQGSTAVPGAAEGAAKDENPALNPTVETACVIEASDTGKARGLGQQTTKRQRDRWRDRWWKVTQERRVEQQERLNMSHEDLPRRRTTETGSPGAAEGQGKGGKAHGKVAADGSEGGSTGSAGNAKPSSHWHSFLAPSKETRGHIGKDRVLAASHLASSSSSSSFSTFSSSLAADRAALDRASPHRSLHDLISSSSSDPRVRLPERVDPVGGVGRRSDGSIATRCRAEELEQALEAGADWDERVEPDRQNIFHVVCAKGRDDLLEVLLSHAPRGIDCKDKRRRLPLHYAAQSGSKACVQTLLRAGAAVEVRDKAAESPLHLAASQGRTEVVKILSSQAKVSSSFSLCKGRRLVDWLSLLLS